VRKRITPGTALGFVAVLLCLSGTAFAAKTVITGKDIRDGSIQARDLSSGLKEKVNRVGAQGGTPSLPGSAGKDGAAGAQGPAGGNGSKGDKGDKGEKGLSGYEVRTYDYIAGGARPGKDGEGAGYGGAGNSSVATVACSSQDKVATGGGYFIRNGTSEEVQSPEADGSGVGVVASFPGRMNWDTLEPRPNRLDGWIVQFNGNGGPAFDVTLYVICVNAP
jgi:hypothetical protein